MTKPAPELDKGDADLRVRPPESVAAGVRAVAVSLKRVRDEAGLVSGGRALLKLNQPGGFDCPGCAWPEPANSSHFEFCENGAKAVAEEATLRRIGPAFFAAHSIEELRRRSDHWLGQQGRLTTPMHRASGDTHYRPVGWDDAFRMVADALRASGDPDRAVFYTSGRTSNEAAFLYQLFVRMLGTNNLPDCSNMCHESSSVALGETIGLGKGTVSLEDVHDADLLLVVGQNPGTNHPRMLAALEEAKRRGARIIAVNPLPEAGLMRFKNPQRARGVLGRGTVLADLFLQVKVGTDLALFTLLNRRLLEADALDHAFIDEHCDGFDELASHLRTLDEHALLAATGLSILELDEAVAMVVASQRTIVCWSMGLTQHKAAVPTIREIVNLLLLRGSIGSPGAGVCPVRGHSNVQGDRTMGIVEQPKAEFLDALERAAAFRAPRASGYDTVAAISAMSRGDVDVFMGMGGNFASAAPDTGATTAALARCALTVQVSTKLNRAHVECGEAALILPCLGRTEVDRTGGRAQRVTVEDSMSMVHASTGSLEPASGELRSEVAIVCGLARAVLGSSVGVNWEALELDYDAIRDLIERVVPGFARFNERITEPGGFRLPHPARDGTFADSGTAHLTVNPFVPIVVPPGRLLLQTVRSHDQFNTTIYGLDDRYRGISQGRRVVFVHPDDLALLGFADGDVVDVVSEFSDAIDRRAESFRLVAYPTARGTCAAYFPEANVLVPLGSVADGSRTPTSKSVVVRFER
ncbi:MAG: FdhF/YdeP family oxidoreductase [Acidimicrobiales bacterium]